MKTPILLIMCLTLSAVRLESVEEQVAALHKFCIDKSGVDEALVNQVNEQKIIEDNENLKCYMMCIMKTSGTMRADGTFNMELLLTLDYIPTELHGKIAAIGELCGNKVGATHCDNAWLLQKCYLENMGEDYFFL